MRSWFSGFMAGAAFVGLTVVVPNGGGVAPALAMVAFSVFLWFLPSGNGSKSR